MNIAASIKNDTYHNLHEPGSYEWWYFDAIDEKTGFSFVVIWYSGFPFSPYYLKRYRNWKDMNSEVIPTPLEHAGFSFNLYENGKELVNFIKEGNSHLFQTSTETPFAKFEDSQFSYNEKLNRYELSISFFMPSRRKKIKAALFFEVLPVEGLEKVEKAAGGEKAHTWVLAALSSKVTGEFEFTEGNQEMLIPFNGSGYHDHNYGRVPMGEDIYNWYWGRAHSENKDLVYYVISYKDENKSPFAILFLKEKDQITDVFTGLTVDSENSQKGFLIPEHSRSLTLSNDRVKCMITHSHDLETGPFYLRFNSIFLLKINNQSVWSLQGISEFLHPDRIDSELVRNLIKSKIWREGENSLMYTLYNFFNSCYERLQRFHWSLKPFRTKNKLSVLQNRP
ncbi:MAG: carotenoid 1,2-hydratase [Chloroherpetonaceae bacterium]|nr:carotenoid 1,2-hydratase [Chloroherpetonaceae bacterium]